MAVQFYFDQHIKAAITSGLRARGVDVLTAFEDGASELPDALLLDRATELKRLVFSQDDDFLREAQFRLRNEIPFTGVIYVHQLKLSVGRIIHELEIIAKIGDFDELENDILYLPL